MSRRGVWAIGLGLAVAVGVAGAAWACTTFSMINLSVASGLPGTEIVVRGDNAAASSPVALRWDSRSAPKAAEVTADADGRFVVGVKAPEVTGGVHVLLATDGKGQIARGAFEVSSGAPGQAVGLPASFHGGTAPAQPTDWLRLGANLLGFGLAGAALVMGVATMRRRPVPAAQASRSPRR